MGMFLFLTSFPAAIIVWILLARKLKESGKSKAVRHFTGAATGFASWVVLIILGITIDPPKTTDNIEPTPHNQPANSTKIEKATDSETIQKKVPETEKSPVATLDLDWDTFRKRVDEDFETAGFGFAKIPDSMKPEGDANAMRLTAMLPINDNLVGNIATDPATGKLTSITATVGANSDAAENLKNFSSAALMLSAAAGDHGNRTVGGKILKMAGDAVNEFTKQSKKDSTASVNKNFVEDGVKYSILVSGIMPVMMFAEPAENNR
ncbi:hypothetical protein [Neisseria weaveri]|uniref:Uncharacterized protein n=1 Tax=Neisseria weaveri TaxID=28091 RepID=A0A3S5A8E8_9NEIS|nr:hypothetical protein [Neisseria weaveri]EGV38424.1 hypothetical protein l11_04470 [Neisseria weaveri LMG 5135]VEJ50049.1 Uncharacterised protein [Neisseria weaveri]